MKNGINIETEDGQVVGASTAAATGALAQVIPSRVAMAAPGMIIPPLIMARLEKTAAFIKNPWLKAPVTVRALPFVVKGLYLHSSLLPSLMIFVNCLQVLLSGVCLTFSTPLCCALFPQKAAIQLNDLEPELKEVRTLLSAT